MMGLLKAYLPHNAVIEATIDDRYVHRPDRLGMTIAYGEMPDEARALVGVTIQIKPDRIVQGEMTAFAICGLTESEESAHIYSIRKQLPTQPKPLHMTLGWIEGAFPAQAGDECATFWRDIMPADLAPADYYQKTLTATIEFKNFEDT